MRTCLRHHGVEAAVVLLLVVIEGTFFHTPQWNQNARLAATAAFVEPNSRYTLTLRIDGFKDGNRLPTGDWAQSHGAFYSNKAPGISLMGIVPYFLLYQLERAAHVNPTTPHNTQVNAYLLNLWISVFWNAVAAVMLIRKLPRLGVHTEQGAILVALVYSFATLVLPFGCSEWGHTTAAAFITLGILYLLDGTQSGAGLAGLWLGTATLTEYFAGASLLLSGVFILQGREPVRRVLRFAVGAAPPIVTLLIYQKLCFGGFLTTAVSLSNPIFLQAGKTAGVLGAPNLGIIWRILFENERGVFFQMPVLLLSSAGVLAWYRSRQRGFVWLAIANIGACLMVVSGMGEWRGGATTSMRYMIIVVPFFCVLLPDLHAFRYRKLFLLLFTVSAAEMLALSATNTMTLTADPLSGFVYPALLNRALALNPLLTSAGVRGRWIGSAIAVAYTVTVGWLLRVALSDRRTMAAPAIVQ